MTETKETKTVKVPEYGVCDSLEQLARLLKASGAKLPAVYHIRKITRADQPEMYGWRWHKWGGYVGEFDISDIEYIAEADGKDDHPLIDVQYCFSEYNYETEGCIIFTADGAFREASAGYIPPDIVEREGKLLGLIASLTRDTLLSALDKSNPDMPYIRKYINAVRDMLDAVTYLWNQDRECLTKCGIVTGFPIIQRFHWMRGSWSAHAIWIMERDGANSALVDELKKGMDMDNWIRSFLSLSAGARELLLRWHDWG